MKHSEHNESGGAPRTPVRANVWILAAALNGFLAVAAAALGAHALSRSVGEDALYIFRQGADFHMSHALAMLGVGILYYFADPPGRRMLGRAGAAFQAGILLFSGTLYWLGAFGSGSLGPFHWLTPLGGISLLAGWALLSLAAWKVIWGGPRNGDRPNPD